jgi:hypothetical protein
VQGLPEERQRGNKDENPATAQALRTPELHEVLPVPQVSTAVALSPVCKPVQIALMAFF